MRLAASTAPITLSTLRKLWKVRRDSYADALLYEDNRIRIHRAFTWLERAAEVGGAKNDDARLDDRIMAQWAGISALFARWERARKGPMPEPQALALFVGQLLAHDHEDLIPQVLERERALVQGMFNDRYLARLAPAPVNATALYRKRRWARILTLLLDRAALVHAQLALGGASYASRENRAALKRTAMVLDALAIAFIQIVTNHGYSDEWGELCWPPPRKLR